MNDEERRGRTIELLAFISKAKRELSELDPSKMFIKSLQEEIEEVLAEIAVGENYESKVTDLCSHVVEGLNILNEKAYGRVVIRPDSVTIGTDCGTITYEVDNNEWFFS